MRRSAAVSSSLEGSPADRTGLEPTEPAIVPTEPPDAAPLSPSDEDARRRERLDGIARVTRKIAHNLNNHLLVFDGGIEHVLHQLDEDPDAARRMLSTLQTAVDSLKTLTQDLQRFPGGDERRAALNDLIPLLGAVANATWEGLPESVRLTVEAVEAPAHARVEPEAFQDALRVLIENAVEAGAQGVTIRLHRPPVADAVAGLVLEVEDDGSGMDAETRARLFEPFFSTKSTKGRGRGLARVWGFVCQCDASVEVESRTGDGTKVSIRFPPPHSTSRGWPQDEREVDPNHPDGSDHTVLLVDDEQPVRHFVSEVLDGAGFHMLVAANGHDALELAREHPGTIDLLLTDVIMPGMDGREVAQRFAAIRPDAKVLFISGFPEDELSFRGGGVPTPLLSKPFTAQELEARVGTVLASRG